MQLNVYAIYDVKAHSFSVPFFSVTEGVARRDFCDLVRDRRSSLYRHPEDYRLHRIGSFDQQRGILSPDKDNKLICTGDEFVEPELEQLKLFPTEADVSMSAPDGVRSL